MREILAFVLLCFALLSFLVFFFFECFDRVVSGLLTLHLSLCPLYILQFYVQWPGRLICADYTDCFSTGRLARGIGQLPEERRRVTAPSFSSHPQLLPALLPVWLRPHCQVFPFTHKDGSGSLLLYHPLLALCPWTLLTKCSLITHSSIKPGQSAFSCWVPD